DRDLRLVDAADQLLLVVGAPLREHPHLAELLRALLGVGAREDRWEVVGDDDHAAPSAKRAWAAATPAPASVLCPRSRRVISSADSVGSTYIGLEVMPMWPTRSVVARILSSPVPIRMP